MENLLTGCVEGSNFLQRRDAPNNNRDSPKRPSAGGGEISIEVVLVASRGRAADQQAAGLAAVSSTCPNMTARWKRLCEAARCGQLASPRARMQRHQGRTNDRLLMHSGVWGCIGPNGEEAPNLVCLTVPSLPCQTTLPGRGMDRTSSTLIHLHVPIHLPFPCPQRP
jgi:hypothetical protein